MTVRTLWRRTAFFSCFLMVVGIVEYVAVVQLQGSLQVGEREEERLLAGGRSFTLLERESERLQEAPMQVAGDWRGRRRGGSERVHGGGEVASENLDPPEVRLARELHDLRVDRLRNFDQRPGSFLSDQWKRNFDTSRKSQLLADQQQLKHKLGAGSHNQRYSEMLNLSRLVDEILSPEGKGHKALRQFFEENEGDRLKEKLDKLYDIYTAKGQKGSTTKDAVTSDRNYEDDYTDLKDSEEEEEEEEEGERKRLFDPQDFIVSVGPDGLLNVSRKPLPPEVLVENTTSPPINMMSSEKAGLNILLTIRYYHVS